MSDQDATGTERRREQRRAVLRGAVEIDGRRYDLADWSQHGFRTTAPIGMAQLGTEHRCRLIVQDEAGVILVSGHCRILRTNDKHSAATWQIEAETAETREMLVYFRQYWSKILI